MEEVDKKIRILAWVVAITLFIFLSLISVFGDKFDSLTDNNPMYGLAILMVPTSILCLSSYILGDSARRLGVHFSYIKAKLLMQPVIWLSILLGLIVMVLTSGS